MGGNPDINALLQAILQAQGSTTQALVDLQSALATSTASTTETIYTVGYNAQIYGGIFLLLVFGYLGYTFTRRYV